MKVGDRVREKRHPESKGTVISIGTWTDDWNPYKIMVRMDKDNRIGNYKEAGLEVENEI